jgi:phage baseplate assembly protein W
MKQVDVLADILGTAPIAPFTRSSGDISNATGVALMQSRLKQILGTKQGELPWRPDFGSALDALRHKNTNEAFYSDARDFIAHQIKEFEPDIQLEDVSIYRNNTAVVVHVKWSLAARSVNGAAQLVDTQVAELAVPLA